ncbi:MAG: hypothetical protein LBH72_00045 [Proteiniphilum sp.]|jgi:hypothetical protein|nr:hypothetical protein [Proteiniphilum sp.]
MKNKTLLNSVIEVKNESDAHVTIQLAKTMIVDADGEREVCPEICIMCENGKKYKPAIMLFTAEQADKLISKLTTLRDAAQAYQANRKLD